MIFTDEERQAPLLIEEAEVTHLARYRFALQFLDNGDSVLDAPCGTGYGTYVLSRKGTAVYGVDIHQGAIQHARECFRSSNTSYLIGNIENLRNDFPASERFNTITSFEGIEHIERPELFLSEAKRLLSKKGTLIISTPRKPHGSPYHTQEYSLKEFTTLLSRYFRIKKVYGQIYTDIFDMETRDVNPHSYTKFNFIVHCIKE